MTREEADQPQLERIEEKLDALTVQQTALSSALSVRCPFESGRIDEITHDLWGNGKPGIKTRLERLERILHVAWVVVCVASAMAGMAIGSFLDSFFARGVGP